MIDWRQTLEILAGASLAMFVVAGCATRHALEPDQWHDRDDGETRVRVSHFPENASRKWRLIEISSEMPKELLRGIPFPALITLRSLANYPLDAVSIALDVGNLAVSDCHPEPDAETADGKLLWRFNSLTPGETRDIRLTIVANEGTSIDLGTTVSLTREIASPLAVRNPSLTMRLEAPREILLQSLLPLTVAVENNGDGTSRDIAVDIHLPSGFVVARPSASATDDAPLAVAMPTVPPGDTQRLEVAIQAPHTGRFTVGASLQAPPDLAARASHEFKVVAARLELQTIPPPEPCPDVPSIWTFMVRNTGDAPARATMLTCELPPEILFLSAPSGDYASGRITWNLGTLVPDQTETAFAETVVRKPMDVVAPVELSAVGAESLAATFEASYWHRPILAVDLHPAGRRSGVWEFVVHNTGTREALDVQVVGEFRNAAAPKSVIGATTGNVAGQQIVFEPLPKLPPRSRARWQIEFDGADTPAITLRCTARHLPEAIIRRGGGTD